MYNHTLILEDLKLNIYIGALAAERSKKQTVILQLKIIFPTPPRACKTAKLSDTICYAELIEKIKNYCKNKKFILIEELGTKIFNLVKKDIPKTCKLYLRIAKQRPLPELFRSVFEIT